MQGATLTLWPQTLRARLLAAFLVPTAVLFAVAGFSGYTLNDAILEEELGRSLSAIAASAASQLSGERMLTILPGDDHSGTRTFRNLQRLLDEVRRATGVRRIFAVDADLRVRLDAGGGLPVGAEMPELLRDRAELRRVFSGHSTASEVLFDGNDGRTYKTGYAPVFHGATVVGAVGVEGSAEFFGPVRTLFQAYATLVASTLALLAAVALIAARQLAQPLARLVSSALRIGRGDLETPVPLEQTVEIGILSRQLEEMRRALANRDQQLKMMLAGVAHEVRNPMGGIELFAGLLAEELAQAPQKDAQAHVERIQKEIQYLKRIVEDFLAFSRESRLEKVPLSAPVLVDSARELLRGEAAGKQVTLECQAAPATLPGDESLLTAALVNLVKNAVQASPEQATVTVVGWVDGGQYLIEVADRGSGIPPELRERIFEPFFTTRQKGTGLGLPLARKVVEAHRGQLTLRSSSGGTTFCLSLPLS